MDNPGHEHNIKAETFQDPFCSPLEHEDPFSVHPEDQLVEQWMSSESSMLPKNPPETPSKSFQPLLQEPGQLIKLNGRITLKAAGVLRLYSTLWGTYKAKFSESQRLEKENEALRVANLDLLEQRGLLERRHADQGALIAYYGQIFEKVRQGMAGALRDWEGSPTEANWEEVVAINENAS